MTLEDLEKIDKNFLTPKDISKFLGCDQYTINLQAQADKEKLGFPVVVTASRVRIPKEGFIFWYKYGKPIINTECKE